MTAIEKLTDYDRGQLAHCYEPGYKALRIIDAHEADRAALVARAEAADEAFESAKDDRNQERALREHAEAESAALRAELAEARALLESVRVVWDGGLTAVERDGLWNATGRWSQAVAERCDALTKALSANPVSPRAAAERAVLDAVGALPNDDLVEASLEDNGYAPGAALARAELALRAVKP